MTNIVMPTDPIGYLIWAITCGLSTLSGGFCIL